MNSKKGIQMILGDIGFQKHTYLLSLESDENSKSLKIDS